MRCAHANPASNGVPGVPAQHTPRSVAITTQSPHVIASVIDTAGDFAVGMMVGRGLPTINFRVDYLKPAVDTALIAVSRVRRAGRSVGVADVDVFDEKGALLAVGRGTYSTLES